MKLIDTKPVALPPFQLAELAPREVPASDRAHNSPSEKTQPYGDQTIRIVWRHSHCGKRPREETPEECHAARYCNEHQNKRYDCDDKAGEKVPPPETDPHLNRKQKPRGAKTQKRSPEDHGQRQRVGTPGRF